MQSLERSGGARHVLFIGNDNLEGPPEAVTRQLERCNWRVHTGSLLNGDLPSVQAPIAGVVLQVCREGARRLNFVANLRRQFPSARIVVFTSYPSVPLAVAAMRAGADDCLTAPLSSAELVRSLLATTGPEDVVEEFPSLARVEWEHIGRALAHAGGNVSAAARLLGIQRSTLQRKLRKFPPAR